MRLRGHLVPLLGTGARVNAAAGRLERVDPNEHRSAAIADVAAETDMRDPAVARGRQSSTGYTGDTRRRSVR
jgi:hypothetical protein